MMKYHLSVMSHDVRQCRDELQRKYFKLLRRVKMVKKVLNLSIYKCEEANKPLKMLRFTRFHSSSA